MTLAECTFDTGGIGVEASIDHVPGVTGRFADVAALFGESASRIVVSVADGQVAAVLEHAVRAGVPARVIGRTGGAEVRIHVAGVPAIRVPVADAEARWATAIGQYYRKAGGAA